MPIVTKFLLEKCGTYNYRAHMFALEQIQQLNLRKASKSFNRVLFGKKISQLRLPNMSTSLEISLKVFNQ